MKSEMPWRTLRLATRQVVNQRLELHVEGLFHLPLEGPAIIAGRHFHHLYDGCVMFATIPRPMSAIAAADWLNDGAKRRGLQLACKAASWPLVLRPDLSSGTPRDGSTELLRTALAESVGVLQAGRVLLVFPEGYPNIDPNPNPKTSETDFLPFEAGMVRIARIAALPDAKPIPIVPAGLRYTAAGDQWRVDLHFGPPRFVRTRAEEGPVLQALENDVRLLSGLPPAITDQSAS